MSLLPLPRIKCGPLNQRKYPPEVVGTPNIVCGHRLQERRDCRVSKSKRESFFERASEDPQVMREYEHILKTHEFVKHTDRRIKRKNVWRRVQQGMADYEESVNVRRQKLRELILNEEMGYTREIVEQAQRGGDAQLDEIRIKTVELKKRQEEQRLAMVAAKRMQQYLTRCPEIRDKITKKSTYDAKLSNKIQMAENDAKKLTEKELDSLWHRLMLKEIEAKKEREIEETKKRALVARQTVTTLAKQVAGKLALEEEKKEVQKEEREYLEQLWKNVREEEIKNLERERKNREILKKDLEEQILTTKRYLAERAREETAMDQMLKSLAEEELSKEKAKIKESSAALRKELLAYLQYLEDIRREEAKRNLEVDVIVEESLKNAHARRDLAVKKFKEAQERTLRDVLLGREEQMKIKRVEERKELELRQIEKELLEKEIELNAKLTAEEREKAKLRALRYGEDLKEQKRYIDEMRRREAERDDGIYQESLRKEEEYQKLTQELLEASENITPHPFKVLLKECAARYSAEKEGNCYCPPVPLE